MLLVKSLVLEAVWRVLPLKLVIGKFVYVRKGEIYTFVFKTCLLELSTLPLLPVESSSVPSGRCSALNPI